MYIDELLRNKAYFIIDKLKGGIVSKKIQELDAFEKLNTEEELQKVVNKLNVFLNEVFENVDFYKENKEFYRLPVINKKSIISDTNSFLSKKYRKEELIPVHTSGSYGTPLTYYLTHSKKKSQLAEVIYYGRKSGYDVGIRHGYFRSSPHKSKFKFWLQNEVFFASKILNNDFISNGIKELKESKVKSLIGFPSAIAYLAKECIEKGYKSTDFYVEGVITSSENLTQQQRDVIKKAFNCKIHSRYSTEELGVIGQQYEKNGEFELNTCNYIFEVLKLEKDESVGIGEIGRIVITDLNSHAMPLIRYETGDMGVLGEFLDEKKGWVKSISQLSGRVMQILYSTNDEVLYPLYFDSIMDEYKIFGQYQIIQLTRYNYILKLVTNGNFDKNNFNQKDFLEKFYNWLGRDASLEIEFVEDIEKLPSGKRPYIINKYKQYTV
ncbi:hypothetical protein VSP20_05220 [Myroides phaeus]|uniref:hypothetical protein n=1 Tax=Myroides phaeus TaxID=702745 RepID=UPI002DBBE093|nr:hypothetical protein [Myroides phaeus]MEC4116366.1 hypothetical protein [Myroides phaeus]